MDFPNLDSFVLLIFSIDFLISSTMVKKILGLSGSLLLIFKLITFKRWGDETKHMPRFLFWFILMLVELSVENCMVW